jgi:predicted Fe-Mo cluster-binding NifX family protein
MKIAVPSVDERGLDSEVSSHFGRTPFYTIVSTESGEIKEVEVIKNPFTEHSPGDVPNFLRQKEVDVILAYGMGRRARTFFGSMKIRVIIGAQGKVGEVVRAFLRGNLSSDESWMKSEEFGHKRGCNSKGECGK